MIQPLYEFYTEFNKTGAKVFEVVWVSCDKDLGDFKQHFEEMNWVTAVSFENDDALGKLEELCGAENIPKIAVINRQKNGGTEVAIPDIKRVIMRKQNMSDAVEEVKQDIINNF